jgi:hypothetical protein
MAFNNYYLTYGELNNMNCFFYFKSLSKSLPHSFHLLRLSNTNRNRPKYNHSIRDYVWLVVVALQLIVVKICNYKSNYCDYAMTTSLFIISTKWFLLIFHLRRPFYGPLNVTNTWPKLVTTFRVHKGVINVFQNLKRAY